MKSFKVLSLFLLVGFAAAFTSCNGCSKQSEGPTLTAFEQQLEAKDTVEVEQALATFFGHIQNKKFYDAAAMLYTRQDTSETPTQYTNEEMDKFVTIYKQLPFEGYKIDYMKFLSSKENEVACSIILQKGQNGQPDAVSKIFFNPVMVAGKWCLILSESRKFEEPITNFDQRDSLKERYDNYKKTHK